MRFMGVNGNMTKRAIVTGATSFIGRELCAMLAEMSYEIEAVVRPNSNRVGNVPILEKIHIHYAELSEISRLKFREVKHADVFFHLGWSSDFEHPRFNTEGQQKNVGYTLQAVELAQMYGCSTFICVGSQAECGRLQHKIGPETEPNPETAYAVAKCYAYEASFRKCEEYGIKQCWPRLLSAYGPHDKQRTLIMSLLKACKEKNMPLLTPCEQIWDYVYVRDVVDALMKISVNGKHGKRYTIASGIGLPLKTYVEKIAIIGENELILDGIGKKEYSNEQVMYLVGDISQTTEDTGFIPKWSFEEGIYETMKEYLGAM